MNRQDLRLILILELAVILIVTACFRLIPEKTWAALVAGSVFIALGVIINLKALRWSSFYKSATFWAVQAHLFFSSIPLLVTRIIYLEKGFADIQIFGIPGPEFHKISTGIYLVLILATALDWLRVRRST